MKAGRRGARSGEGEKEIKRREGEPGARSCESFRLSSETPRRRRDNLTQNDVKQKFKHILMIQRDGSDNRGQD
jgi:hypothetical protein